MPLVRAQYATDAGRRHFADQLTSIRYWSGPHLEPPLLASHAHAHADSRSLRVPRSVQETCNCMRRNSNRARKPSPQPKPSLTPNPRPFAVDVLYAYLTSANYDFSCAKTSAPTHPTF